MERIWRILVVDDEDDVHLVTRLAMRGRKWKGAACKIWSAHSAEEARALLSEPGQEPFDVALVDVVMESSTAGLELCRHIRQECPRTTRIILRTGQPGTAPEEQVLNDYDIDYYLAKTDSTAERLFATIRACLRTSQDIQTLLTIGEQMQRLTVAMREGATDDTLVQVMSKPFQMLRDRYGVGVLFMPNHEGDAVFCNIEAEAEQREGWTEALRSMHRARELANGTVLAGPELGLDAAVMVMSSVATFNEEQESVRGGVLCSCNRQGGLPETDADLIGDLRLLLENWSVAYSAIGLQRRLLEEQMLRQNMYLERSRTIAMAVSSISHDVNTPIGVAKTASSTMQELIQSVSQGDATVQEELDELWDDLKECASLVNRNLDRASDLIRSFKSVTCNQASDQRQSVSLYDLVQDCIGTMTPETRRKGVEVKLEVDQELDVTWDGYPSHLTQIVMNLFQNVFRYAYDETHRGPVAISLAPGGEESFRLQFRDFGKGIDESVRERIFDPFVTTGRDSGGTGLGLAICHDIATRMLGGSIRCESKLGDGTLFTLEFPRVCPVPQESNNSPS